MSDFTLVRDGMFADLKLSQHESYWSNYLVFPFADLERMTRWVVVGGVTQLQPDTNRHEWDSNQGPSALKAQNLPLGHTRTEKDYKWS